MRSGEQVAYRLPSERVEPSPSAMFARIMAHVAALAECSEVARPVVARIVVQVRAGQHHTRYSEGRGWPDASQPRLHALQRHWRKQAAHPPPLPVAPACRILVPPLAIAEMVYVATVGTPAMLAPPLRPGEPDMVRQLSPVDGVEPAMLARDRHSGLLSQVAAERKQKTPVIQIIHKQPANQRLSESRARSCCPVEP